MGIAVICANCGWRLRFKNEHAGKSTTCRACGKPLVVRGDAIPDHDVFISYSSKDQPIADAVCSVLETRKIRCWIAPRDIVAGKAWAAAILDGLEDCRAMVLIFSGNSNTSTQVLREVDRAVNRTLPIVPFRIENASMSKEMEYYIGASHWLDALDGAQEKNIARLADTITKLLTDGPASPKARAKANAALDKPGKAHKLTPVAALCSLGVGVITLGLLLWAIQRFKPQLIQNVTTYVSSRTFGRSAAPPPGPSGGGNPGDSRSGAPGAPGYTGPNGIRTAPMVSVPSAPVRVNTSVTPPPGNTPIVQNPTPRPPPGGSVPVKPPVAHPPVAVTPATPATRPAIVATLQPATRPTITLTPPAVVTSIGAPKPRQLVPSGVRIIPNASTSQPAKAGFDITQ